VHQMGVHLMGEPLRGIHGAAYGTIPS